MKMETMVCVEQKLAVSSPDPDLSGGRMGGSLLVVLAVLVLFAVPARAADLFLVGEREMKRPSRWWTSTVMRHIMRHQES